MYKLNPLYDKETIRLRVAALAQELAANREVALQGVTFVGMLKGATLFLADLLRAYPPELPTEVDYLWLSSYDGTESTQRVAILDVPDVAATRNKHVVIVEDIVDTGLSLKEAVVLLSGRTKTIRTCVLLDKPEGRLPQYEDVRADYVGFTLVGKPYVVGYGLDYNENLRNLDGIYELEAENGTKSTITA